MIEMLLQYSHTQNEHAIEHSPALKPLRSCTFQGSSASVVGPLSFLDVINDLHAGSAGVVIFARKEKSPLGSAQLRTLGGCAVDEIRKQHQAISELLKADGFMSINTIFRSNVQETATTSRTSPFLRYYRRRIKDLADLTAAYVDIDCGKLGFDPTQILIQAFTLLSAQQLPLPTHVCFSGSGLWLLWRFLEPIHAWPEKTQLLRRLNNTLVRTFKHFGADPAATDAARIMRCAGSINTKTGAPVQFFRIEHSRKHSFRELLQLFQVPPQRTSLPGEARTGRSRNPRRVEAGKLRYGRRLSGFFQLLGVRGGAFKKGTRHQAIFGLAVLLFKNGVALNVSLAKCAEFARKRCIPPVTDTADIERRVRAASRYREHISDARFIEWFHITPAEMLQLSDWFRPPRKRCEPAKARIARRRELVQRERHRLGSRLSAYKAAQIVTPSLKQRYGIDVSSMTVLRDLQAIEKEEKTHNSQT